MTVKVLKCPVCGSVLGKRKKSSCECPNPDCKVIKVVFRRNHQIKEVITEGFGNLKVFGRGHKAKTTKPHGKS